MIIIQWGKIMFNEKLTVIIFKLDDILSKCYQYDISEGI